MSDVNEQTLLARRPGPAGSEVQSTDALLAEVARLKRAVLTRQQLGLVTGLVAERFRLTPDQAWEFLVELSQHTNVKLREIARVIYDGFCGCLADEDRALAARVNALRPKGAPPVVDLSRSAGAPPSGEGTSTRAAR